MNSVANDLAGTIRAEAEKIVASGAEIRPRLAEVVAQAGAKMRLAGEGLVGLTRAVLEGAREGLVRSAPEDRDDVLRQVIDALGDGLSQAALAGRLAVQEGTSAAQQFAGEDLAKLRDELSAVRGLFAETVERGVKSCTALTGSRVSAALTHAERVAGVLGPKLTLAIEAIGHDPMTFARESLRAGFNVGQSAAGALFQSLGQMLQRAGDELRREREQSQ